MKPHIADTITEINSRIALLRSAALVLETLDQIAPLAHPVAVQSASAPPPPKPANTCHVQPTKPAPQAKASKPAPYRVDSARVIGAARKLVEPFNTKDLARNADITRNAAGGYLFRWRKCGWVELISRDNYKRTATFGGPTEQSNALLDEIHRDIASAKPKED